MNILDSNHKKKTFFQIKFKFKEKYHNFIKMHIGGIYFKKKQGDGK